MTPWPVAGVVLVGLGLERLANVGLLGGEPTSYPGRFLFGTSATILGALVLAVMRCFSSR